MKSTNTGMKVITGEKANGEMFKLVSNDEYSKNLNAIIAYHQISKGEAKKRFVSNTPGTGAGRIAS